MKQDRELMMQWSTTWSDLPDPRAPNTPYGPMTKIRITEDFWRHIEKHLLNEERAWDDLLGSTLRRRVLQAIGQEDTKPWHDLFQKASEILERQCRSALWRPLLIRFSHSYEWNSSWNQRWLLVLPIGAVAIVRLTKHKQGEEWKLITAFFDRVERSAKSDRWRAAARKQFDRYRQRISGYFAPPSVNKEYIIPQLNKSCELHRTVRLVSPQEWGVCEEHGVVKWVPKLNAWPDISQQELSLLNNLERYL